MTTDKFPFELNDIVGWVLKRKDGTVLRFNLTSAQDLAKTKPKTTTSSYLPLWHGSAKAHYSDWCDHEPHPDKNPPIFESEGIALWIADAAGARKSYKEFDVAIDGGNALTVPGEYDLPTLYGDPLFAAGLADYVIKSTSPAPIEPTRVLKIRWADRCPPPLKPTFWPALLDELRTMRDALGRDSNDPLRIVTICQGGHGRSGSALAALIMCLSDYSPLDALTHIRSLHCARAIESKDQHLYLNAVGQVLGRKPDALDAEEVKSFKDRFLGLANSYAEMYKDRVRAGKGAKVEARDGAWL